MIELEGLTRRLVAHVRGRVGQPLPADVEATARLCLLDWLGVVIAGKDEPLTRMLLEEAMLQGGGRDDCSIVGHRQRCAPAFAAMVNAAAADALDFSDGNLAMRGHTTPAVVGTALALAEVMGASLGQLVDAVVAGVETECRIGLVVNPPRLRKGFHPTGSMATFGAAAAAATLLGLDDEEWEHAIGLAATQAAGVLASGGTMAKPFHSGKAAMNGMLAAQLAGRGFVANPRALEAPSGYLDTHAQGEFPAEVLNMQANDEFTIMGTIFKSHAACQLTHSTIANMTELRTVHGMKADDVETIGLQVPRGYMSVCNIQHPVTALEAKFSLRAVAAMTLLGDDTREIAAYEPERILRPAMKALIPRISVQARDDIHDGTSIAIVRTRSGQDLALVNDTYKPEPDMNRKRDSVTWKFRSLAGPIIGMDVASTLGQQVLHAGRDLPVVAILAALAAEEST